MHNETYQRETVPITNSVAAASSDSTGAPLDNEATTAALNRSTTNSQETCYFCGNKRHPRRNCPAASRTCLSCGKRGHFAKVCKSKPHHNTSNALMQGDEGYCSYHRTSMVSCMASATGNGLDKTIIQVLINKKINARALIDTGSTGSLIDKKLVERNDLLMLPGKQKVTMAKSNFTAEADGLCPVTIDMLGYTKSTDLMIMEYICADVIIGLDIMAEHKSVEVELGGRMPPLKVPLQVPPKNLSITGFSR
ncbi:hypothetical protein NE865_02721 [Phthorimaea operculella]|nr:hypothetical protein NE865_02721 [Phthorimaea operculella]